ncbi:MAG: hypothetical protein JWQ71_3824 [Pedosphaera sp.]|nr:hypothetical protein [Pedosphaera sp.]
MKQSIQLSALLILSLLLTGCSSLSPVKNEIPLVKGGLDIKPTNTNDTKLVIFNDSSVVGFGIDGTGRINVKLNDKGVAQLNIGRYTQVIVPKGKYQVDLEHLDMFHFTSQHQIELVKPESFLMIYATPTSNKAELLSTLPQDFEQKYRPVE